MDRVDGIDLAELEIAQWDGITAPNVSPANSGRVYYDSTLDYLLLSENGGAYSRLLGITGANLTYLRLDCANDPLTAGLDVAPDTDVAGSLGRFRYGYIGNPAWANYPVLSHYDCFNATDYALTQSQGGWTYLNAVSNLDLCIGGVAYARINVGGFSVRANPILFGALGSEDIEIMRLGARNLGIYSDYGNVDLDLTGSLTATATVQAEHLYSTDDLQVDGTGTFDGDGSDNAVIVRSSKRLVFDGA
jgi:hypothetical protein